MNPFVFFGLSAASTLIMGGINYIVNTIINIPKYKADQSLVSMSQMVRVEPMCLVDSTLRSSESLNDIQNTILNMFASFYVQSVTLSLIDKEVKVSDKIGAFGTKTGAQGENSAKITKSDILNVFKDSAIETIDAITSTEEFTPMTYRFINESLDKGRINPFTKETHVSSLESKDGDLVNALKEVKDEGRLSVGKIIGITIRDKQKISDKDGNVKEVVYETMVPIGVRLMTGFIRNDHMLDLLAIKDLSALERQIGYSTGRLSLIKDIIFCRDLYHQFRKNLIIDKNGYLKTTLNNRAQTVVDQIHTGKKRTTGITSIAVMASSTAKAIEGRMNIKLDKFSQRTQFMEQTGMMIMAIVDEDYRMVKFYFHSIEKALESSYSDLKRASKTEPNIGEMIQALSMGNAPRLF